MKPHQPYLDLLDKVRKKIRPELMKDHQIDCFTGEWMDCAVLKLQKKSWTPKGSEEGLFFSIWLGEKDLKKQRFNYNIHALKLRLWKDHRIKPVEFAESFRKKLGSAQKRWPHLDLDYGPQTLMQGWVELNSKTFSTEVLKLVENFVSMHSVLDRMLDERKP